MRLNEGHETLRCCVQAFITWVERLPKPEALASYSGGYWQAMDDARDILAAALKKPDVAPPRFRY